jgi:hypothetical protein
MYLERIFDVFDKYTREILYLEYILRGGSHTSVTFVHMNIVLTTKKGNKNGN